MAFKKPTNVPRKSWIIGLATLSRLWKRGLYPEDLLRHYYLHWFVVYKGNIIQAGKALQIHRNTIQGHFLQLGYSKKSVRMRHAWQKLAEKNSTVPFDKNFHQFYQKFGKRPPLSAKENAGLVGLWQIKFPFKTLTPHYMFWAIRAGKPKNWVQKELGFCDRHKTRLLSHVIKPNTRDGFWLSPLKPKLQEIYSQRYRTVLARKKRR